MTDEERSDLLWGTAAIMIALCLVAVLVGGCANTMAAVEQLPAGYWESTWGLLLGIFWDVMDLVTRIA